ncbi:MAG: hypothetical protein AB1898_14555 [Acidobacteriota bacterium]
MMDPRQRKQILTLCLLLSILLGALYYSYRVMTDSGRPGPVAGQSRATATIPELKDIVIKRSSRRGSTAKDLPISGIEPIIHVQKLEEFNPGVPNYSRNMFSFAAQEQPMAQHRPGVASATGTHPAPEGSTGAAPPSRFNRPTPTPTVVINLKFFGLFLGPGEVKRRGLFEEGDNVFVAGAGDLVANRYRVVRVEEATAEIEEVTSKTRRQLNLVTQ